MRVSIFVLGALLLQTAVSCKPRESGASTTPVDFVSQVKPLLETSCLPCHHSGTSFGNLNLESRATTFRKSDRGTFVVPGNPEASLLYTITKTKHGEQSEVMPADGILLTSAQRDLLKNWILNDAPWPDGKDGILVPTRTP